MLARAQQPPPAPADTASRATPARDTLVRDTLVRDTLPRDTVKSPIAVAGRPAVPTIAGRRVVWDRDALFASGALTLPELIAQVQGGLVYNAGFIAAPTASAWYGEPGRVRVFLDGVELDQLDLREGEVRDLSVVQLWSLEEVAMERAAGELRVHLRSWRVRLTTAQTRTDITTGTENTNLYRGFFGKRMDNGGVLQLAAQQYSTTSVRTAGDGDALAAFGRVGVARGRLTVDAVATRFGRTRSATKRGFIAGTVEEEAIGPFEGNDATAYLRAAWGDADSSGFWMQALWAAQRHQEDGATTDETETPVDSDTTRTATQYVATAGFTRWGARLAATARYRVHGGADPRFAPSVRASWERSRFLVSASAEEGGPDSTRRLDALASLTPFSWLHVAVAHSVHTPEELALGPARTTSRGEVAARLFDRWVSVGIVQRSASTVMGMPVFDTLFVPATIAASTGIEGSVSGPLWRSFSFRWRGMRWSEEALYRPQVESYSEVSFSSSFLRQIRRGTFHLDAGLTHVYRGAVEMPGAAGATQRAEGAGYLGGYVEMRIGTARIFWHNRNATGKIYETVPGYLMPRLVQLYGVRWEFWN